MPLAPIDPHHPDDTTHQLWMREATSLVTMLAIYCAGLALLAALAWYGWQTLVHKEVATAMPTAHWIAAGGEPALRGRL